MKRILWNERGGDIDEIVVTEPKSVHIEQMDDNCWWIGIDLADGSSWCGNFYAERDDTTEAGARMTFTEQESDVAWDRDHSHDDRPDDLNREPA